MSNQETGGRALEIAKQIHNVAGARQTFLFGSRVRGDHRPDSDIDVLVITEPKLEGEQLDDLRQRARQLQKEQMPEASGIDILSKGEEEFQRRARLLNNMANTVLKEGLPIMSSENLNLQTGYDDEEVDWEDVELKLCDAEGAADWIFTLREANLLDGGNGRQFGIMAQNALEFAYKSVIAAHGHEYPPEVLINTI